jgi:RNA polymerase sigma-70 factor (ECF subfamily)
MNGVTAEDLTSSGLHRTADEFGAAIGALDDAGWRKLRRLATARAIAGPVEPDDLLQEAFRRVLDGRRRWPAGVGLLPFLSGVMRSITSGERELRRQSVEGSAVPLYANDGALMLDKPDPRPTPEGTLAGIAAAARLRERVTSLFSDDYEAQLMVEGIMDGMEGEELRNFTGLEGTAFNSKRRLVRRRLDHFWDEGSWR